MALIWRFGFGGVNASDVRVFVLGGGYDASWHSPSFGPQEPSLYLKIVGAVIEVW